jgi:serine/threonine protein kinase/Tfp pilus assembly protein PilF
MIGQTISHYKILEKLGAGGMGVVYKAQDIKLNRTVALKFLPLELTTDSEAVNRFINEAQTASALDHANICTIYEIDETDDGRMFICMAYYEGETLRKKVISGQLPVISAVDIAGQIANGLARAHEAGITHRDIKPENIIITTRGEVKIIDFGIAKLAGQSRLTKTGATLGTVAYMSPEQIAGKVTAHRTDIWSLGVLLYEMLAGQPPFRGEYEAALVYAIAHTTPEPIASIRAGLPPALEEVVEKAMAKSPEARYQRMDDLQADLENAGDHLQEAPTKQRSKRTKRVSRLKYIYAGIAGLMILGLIVLQIFGPQKPAPAARKSVAVLPFQNLDKNEENEYFSDGITEDIRTHLSKIGDLRVISRTSSTRYKKTEKSLRQIGAELGVGFILEGSIRRANRHLRIVSRLIDVSRDEDIWSENYDRDMADILAIQSEVARKIAQVLGTKLSPQEATRIQKKPTENLTAYDYYLKGREYYYRTRKEDNEIAVLLFKKAIALDSTFALAYAGLALAYTQRATMTLSPNWADSAIAVSEKAASIDPDLAEAYHALGYGYFASGAYEKALQAWLKTIDLNPNHAGAMGGVGTYYLEKGRIDEAMPWAKKTLALEPTNTNNYYRLGLAYFELKNYGQAVEWFNKSLELQPDFSFSHLMLNRLYLDRGDYQHAIKHSREILAKFPDDLFCLEAAGETELFAGNYQNARKYFQKVTAMDSLGRTWWGKAYTTVLGYIYWKTGQPDTARKLFKQSLEMNHQDIEQSSEYYGSYYDLAAINAIQGRKDEACDWLQKAIDAGCREYQYASHDPLFENLRSEERFKQMMAKIKAEIDEMRKHVAERD